MTLKPIATFMKMNKQEKGFTLLEILLAVFIFGIVITTLFGSFNAIFGSAEEVDQKTAQREMVGITLDRISEDLAGLYLTHSPLYTPALEESKPDPYRVWGENRNVGNTAFSVFRFTSFAHLPFENNLQKGIAQIIYYVQSTGNGQYVLKRADQLYPYDALEDYRFEDNATDPVLCRDVQSFAVAYIDDQGEAYESWDSEAEEFGFGTPRALKIKIVVGKEERTLNAGTEILLPTFREKKES